MSIIYDFGLSSAAAPQRETPKRPRLPPRLTLVSCPPSTPSSFVIDRTGRPVDTSGSQWTIDFETHYTVIDWAEFPFSDHNVLVATQRWIGRAIERLSPSEVLNRFNELKFVLQLGLANQVSGRRSPEEHLAHVLRKSIESLRSQSSLHRFWRVRGWYSWCAEQDDTGTFSDEFSFELELLELPSNEKGINVHSEDVQVGPLTNFEVRSLVDALERDNSHDMRAVQQRCAVHLGLAFGRNARNFRLLMCSDLKEGGVLQIPRIKKRKSRGARSSFRDVYCNSKVRGTLESLIELNREYFPSRDALPLFLEIDRRSLGSGQFADCISSSALSHLLAGFCTRMDIKARDGSVLHLTFRRLRYTYGTHLARQGVPRQQLADLLDHDDTQSVGVYFDLKRALLKLVDKALGEKASEIAGFFRGRIVASPDAGVDVRQTRQVTWIDSSGGIHRDASCARTTPTCRKAVPIACYTCVAHEPFLEADHEAVYSLALQKQREALSLEEKNEYGRSMAAIREVIIQVERTRS